MDDPQYQWLFNWDGHNQFWSGRILNDTRTYPFSGLTLYSAGQVWSSTLMGIQGDLGRDITDMLVLKSMLYLDYGATGVDNAQAILQADRDLFGGIHLQTLLYWLGTVKKFIDPGVYIPSITHSPPSQSKSGPVEIRATVASERGIDFHRVFIVWGIAGACTDTLLMAATQTPGEFVAFIPAQSHPDTITYFIVAADSLGGIATSPMNAPHVFYSIVAGGTSGIQETADLPIEFSLEQNFPNPFNPHTTIQFRLAEQSTVSLTIYDILGREVTALVRGVY